MNDMSSATGAPDLHVECEDGVARITLARPQKRNAITAQMWDTFHDALERFAVSPDVKVLVVQGDGRCFTAGADLASVRDPDGSLSASFHEKAFRALDSLRTFPQPSIALIDGPCVGAGISIALSCDIRIATPDALLGVPAVSLGIAYEQWAVARLVELVGSGQTSRLLFTGIKISGAEAAALGLIEKCDDDLDRAGSQLIEAIRGSDFSVMRETKRTIRGIAGPAASQPIDPDNRSAS